MTIFFSVYFLNSWIYIYLAQIKLKYMHTCRSVFAVQKSVQQQLDRLFNSSA